SRQRPDPGQRDAGLHRRSGLGSIARRKPAPAVTKMTDDQLRSRLSNLQYQVTQCDATEPPFANDYWNEKRTGIYVDVVDGTPLFLSTDKYDSGTGWPSFTRPISPEIVATRIDNKLGVPRTEIRSATSDSHLGHVFPD